MENNKYVDEIFDEIKKEVELVDNFLTLEPIKASDINKMNFEDKKSWIVEEMIPIEGSMFLTGEPGLYKSWLALHIAIAVYNGDPVFGQFKTTKGNVLYMDEENPTYLVQDRLRKYGGENSDILFMIRSGFRIDNDKHMQHLGDIIRNNNIKLVIFDSFIRFHDQDENSATGIARINRQVTKYLLNNGASALYLHHHGKNNTYRGSSELKANVDTMFSIESTADLGRIILINEKARHNQYVEKIQLSVYIENNNATVTYLGLEDGPLAEFNQATNVNTLIDYLKYQEEFVTIEQIVKDIDQLNDGAIRRAIDSLRKQDKLEVKTGASNKKFYKLKVEN